MGCNPSPKVSGRGSPDVPPWRHGGWNGGFPPFPSERRSRVVRYYRAQLATFFVFVATIRAGRL